MSLPSLRTVITWAVVIIIGLWVINDPSQAGGLVHSIGHGLSHAANSASVFVGSIGSSK